MNFSDVLKDSVNRVDGAVSAMILGVDGIPVEQYNTEKLISLDDLGAESSQMIKNIDTASETLGLGKAVEFSIVSDLCGIIMRRINADYYLAMVITPDGNYGKARFVLKTAVPLLEGEF